MGVHFLPALGHRPLATISPLDVRRAVDALAAKVAPATVRTNLGVLLPIGRTDRSRTTPRHGLAALLVVHLRYTR